ncbi:MAG: ABC transporter [Candidatus Omnitrophica bacterium CG11_big_fil_rev_8_21_14_0_20_42_13]|uniref:ABC transporter n=1 Tax=Candidatus Ghiorseimicrobium undicola TaxID=1974746 RepID=A0A2H0LZS5_9BACT|nr:MAG: ABC transporter [Candidatus Omnitrophica bacterium CG11_big_fil_rev_8_21_14_0_20_42_13]
MHPLLEINNLFGGYERESVLKDVSLSVNKGDFVGIIGPNGSGKTTLLRLLSKILRPHKGEIIFGGRDISSIKLKDFAKEAAFVPQDTIINFSFSVLEIVLMGRIPHLRRLESESKNDLRIARDAMKMTDIAHLEGDYMDELSSGERQRVIIARALAQEPLLIFLDEPTSHLDIAHQVQIMDLLAKSRRLANLTIVTVLHDLNLAGEYCNRIVLLNGGKIFKQGSPEEVLTYQNIEAVYKTVVVVDKNPISGNPYVLLCPKEKA